MDYELSEEQKMLRKTARDFLAQNCPKTLVRGMALDKDGCPRDLWAKMADLGWLGLAYPTEYGGSGSSFLDLAVLMEEAGRALLPGPFLSTVVLAGMLVLEAGSDAQKKELLPRMAAGKMLATVAFTEANNQYGPEGITVKATASAGGYVINGTKMFVPDAHTADKLIVACRSGRGISLFLLDRKTEGLKVTLLHTVNGDKLCQVDFKDVKAGKQQLLGVAGKGWPALEKALQFATAARCAEMVGQGQQVLEMTVAYSKERVQFGAPIGTFEAIQHHCANMATDVDGMRFASYQAAWMLAGGLPCTKEVSVAKAWCNEALRRVCHLGHQVHGGVGLMDDHDLGLYTKRAIIERAGLGNTDWHRAIVGRETLAQAGKETLR